MASILSKFINSPRPHLYFSGWRTDRKTFITDILAGMTGAVAGAPQAMGFAIIAGVSPIYGLYAAAVSTVVGAFTSGSTVMTIAPTNAAALVVGSTLMRLGPTSQIERMIILTLLVGIFQLVFGMLRLGDLTRFVSQAVMAGFITGAGLLIILGQLGHMNGYAVHESAVLPRLAEWVAHLGQSDWQTVIIGLLTVAIIVSVHHTRFKNLAILVALTAATVLVSTLGWEHVELVRDISAIPSGFPAPALGGLEEVNILLVPALAIAVLTLVQSAALTQSIPEPDGSTANVNQDFLGQGISNIVSSLFQGMPAGGSLSRTAVNVSAGGRTRMANLSAGVLIGLILLVFGRVIELIPLAALAGHLVVAAFSLFHAENIRTGWQINYSARLTMVITFLSTLLVPLEYSIYIGIVLSLTLYLYSSSRNIQAMHLVPLDNHRFREEAVPIRIADGEPVIVSVSGQLYFAAVSRLEHELPSPVGAEHPVVILRLRDNQYLGMTGLRLLKKYARELRDAGGQLILSGVSPNVQHQLERTEALNGLSKVPVFYANDVVFSSTEAALEYAHEWLREHTQEA